jgi:hypothetical protein
LYLLIEATSNQVNHRGGYTGMQPENFYRRVVDIAYLASGRHFHLSSLFLHKMLQPDLPGIFRQLKARGLTLSLDTNDDPENRWAARCMTC